MKKKERRIKDKKVILIKPYEVDRSSFINEKINNLLKYIKFIKSPTQIRIFRLLPHYQSLQSREKQDPNFWKEVAMAFVENKYNIETLRNKYPINIF